MAPSERAKIFRKGTVQRVEDLTTVDANNMTRAHSRRWHLARTHSRQEKELQRRTRDESLEGEDADVLQVPRRTELPDSREVVVAAAERTTTAADAEFAEEPYIVVGIDEAVCRGSWLSRWRVALWSRLWSSSVSGAR
jgi:hypothetical protein